MSLIDMSMVHTWIKKSRNLPLAFSNSTKELIQTFNDLIGKKKNSLPDYVPEKDLPRVRNFSKIGKKVSITLWRFMQRVFTTPIKYC